ncbi:hypothetical protein AAG906_021266 [Vitis piasezkii]
MWAATLCLAASRSLYKGATARFPPFHLQQLGLEKESGERKQWKPGGMLEQGQQGRFYAMRSQNAESNALTKFVLLHCSLCVETPMGGKVESKWWNATSYLVDWWQPCGCHLMFGAWRPLYKGAAARFAPFHCSNLALSSIYCLCGTVGPWVKVPKALEEDTPMWVYGVGPTGFSP